ncbi:fimbria/pilus outer membrane usher protein (plasmid) [Cronobacter sakazakii]|uniref:fimbria/pilus outer membrane usher protein n=1 Tax=Cronobacter sakazakii TaxID=28141 RepID=UPI003D7A40DB
MNTKSKKTRYRKILTVLISLYLTKANAQGYYFPVEELQSFGITPRDAKKLLDSNTLQPGVYRIPITINGRGVNYDGKVNIGNDGQPCLNRSLLSDIGINIHKLNFAKDGCLASKKGADLVIMPNSKARRIEILAPVDFLEVNEKKYSEGGDAALFNYNLHAFNLRNKFSNSNSYTGFVTSGFNTGNWIFRNKSTLSSSNGKNEFENTQTYLQKTFQSQSKILKIGDIDYSDQFYGISLRGLQWVPEPSLNGGPITSLQGFSNDDSQIEIYQLGQLVYAGQVHAGYYKIDSVPVLNSQSPYEIVLTSPNGKKNKSIVTAAEAIINQAMQKNSGFSFAAGKATNIKDSRQNEPLVASASYNWNISNDLGLGSGTLISEKYYSIAGNATYSLTPRNTISVTQYIAEENLPNSKGKKRGSSSNLLLTNGLGKQLSLSNSFKYRTNDYRGIEDVSLNYGSKYKWQQSNNLSANFNSLGSLGLTYSIYQGDARKYNSYSATWGRGIFSAYLSATVQKQRIQNKNKSYEETRFYAQISIPLSGRQRVSTSYTYGDKSSRWSSDYRKSENSGLNYGIGYSKEKNKFTTQDTVFAEASQTTKFSHIGGRLNLNEYYKSLATHASGGVAINKDTITFSPYEIGDTFAIVKVGKYSGIELNTPNGRVWTNSNGNAVIPSLLSFGNNIIEVNLKTSPKNLDIMNGSKRLKPSRGTVREIEFDTKEVNRVIVYAKDRSNKPLPYGALVTDEQSETIVGFVDDDGMIFFNDMPRGKVKVSLGNNGSCSIEMGSEDAFSKSSVFTTLHKTCK